ncbi:MULTISPECIES: dihydropteroate synthase [Leptospira]|uniref:Dihydropteroate synthase n=2 Tax=Leptospira weilii TaxID=28184 RepID=M6PZ36_9LEPT|nr:MULTISPECIES: dihydropteroate synthase [Leptospira]EMM74528.1 dihydropteroate synthase [Leptospira weilii str. 2006001855]EMJ64248.1 dihydropteroate synthase [Leptospira sp. P2653]EMN88339.1 dihydropteroate synthase [Leptospira weilii str. UI 13098]MCL8266168.1 dihydropteroate synthase [Leptospira weilii]MDL5246089.1 dihydropteroate synthase [Leptospira weilii]
MESKYDLNSATYSPTIFGVLNITEDSFSDGGKYLTPKAFWEKADSLLVQGADVIDIGAQSSNIRANLVGFEIEWMRMKDLISGLLAKGVRISVDSFQPKVIANALDAGVEFINHIRGFVDGESVREISKYAGTNRKFIVMYSHNHANRPDAQSHLTPQNVIFEIVKFFRERKKVLLNEGITQEQLIFDPGMGFFLSPDFQVSFEVLRRIQTLREEFSPMMVSVTKKSFLGNALGGLKVNEREIATVIAELYLSIQNVEYIRTHEPKNLKQALGIWNLLRS